MTQCRRIQNRRIHGRIQQQLLSSQQPAKFQNIGRLHPAASEHTVNHGFITAGIPHKDLNRALRICIRSRRGRYKGHFRFRKVLDAKQKILHRYFRSRAHSEILGLHRWGCGIPHCQRNGFLSVPGAQRHRIYAYLIQLDLRRIGNQLQAVLIHIFRREFGKLRHGLAQFDHQIQESGLRCAPDLPTRKSQQSNKSRHGQQECGS